LELIINTKLSYTASLFNNAAIRSGGVVYGKPFEKVNNSENKA